MEMSSASAENNGNLEEEIGAITADLLVDLLFSTVKEFPGSFVFSRATSESGLLFRCPTNVGFLPFLAPNQQQSTEAGYVRSNFRA